MKGKVALVTGSSQGIGKAIALALAKEGADVAVNGRRLAPIEATAKEIETLGRKAMVAQADVSDYEQVQRMMNSIVDKFGGIDILVNNAGADIHKLFEDTTKEDWDKIIKNNLVAVLNCSHAVLTAMKRRGGGSIINIGSMAAKSISDMASPDYTAVKAGVLAFTRQLAFEWGRYNIRVNAINPGTVKTAMAADMTPDIEKKLISITPLGRFSKPEEVANIVTFLASDEALMITGTTIDIDGGQRLGFLDWETYVKVRKA